MHRHEVTEQASVRHLSHFNSLFTGWGSRVYDMVMVRLTRRLYQRVVADLATLRLAEGKVLDAGTGPGTLVRELARRFPGLQVYGIDLSEDMIGLARAHARREHLEERGWPWKALASRTDYQDHRSFLDRNLTRVIRMGP